MKGLILSGGKGTRLRPITHTSAKQLVPVANKPVLFYAIEALVVAGISDIGIITGETGAEVEAAVGDGSQFGCSITYIPQDAPSGLAHAVLTAKPFLKEDPFVMYLGDNLMRDGLVDLVADFQKTLPSAMILLTKVDEPERFGVAELEDGKVIRLIEKPKNPPSDLALVGVYLFTAAIFDAISRIEYSTRGELEITDAIQRLIDDGADVVPHIITGWWKDTGKLEDMLEVNRIVLEAMESDIQGTIGDDVHLEGRVVVEAGARLSHCTVRGPAIIGKNTVIDNAYIGPFTAIYYDCIIRNAEIEHSIILEHSIIEDVPTMIDSSLVGKECEVRRSTSRPRAVRLMLGDHSHVEMY